LDVEIFALCDAATEHGGKLNILGTFDTIRAQQFPVVHPLCAIVIRVRFARVENGTHPFRIDFIDADGRPVIPDLNGNINIQVPDGMDSSTANLVLNLAGVKFERAGQYSIDLAIDARHERSLPIHVSQLSSERA
jgi:hypothetical protein